LVDYKKVKWASDFGDLRKIDHIKLNEKSNRDHIKQFLLFHTQSRLAELSFRFRSFRVEFDVPIVDRNTDGFDISTSIW
jgi:hypothetical protein